MIASEIAFALFEAAEAKLQRPAIPPGKVWETMAGLRWKG